jgi:hypothetical protein
VKKIIMLGATVAAFGLGGAAAFTATTDVASAGVGDGQVCPEGDSGKIDVSGSEASITVTAPEGKLISGYCVKAGSANQDLGPEFHSVTPATTVTITPSSGKDISHYSLTLVDEAAETETTPLIDTTPTEPTLTESTPAETTPAETTPAETTPAETTPAETTPAESMTAQTPVPGTTPALTTSTAPLEPNVFTPPTAEKPKPATAVPAAVAAVNASVARPSKAAQAAPFTP